MQKIELLVKLKIPDVTALTAAAALRRRMGYAQVLKELTRADYYTLHLQTDSQQSALALAEELAESTNLFVNPNKHTYELRIPEEKTESAPEDSVWPVEVLVTDAEGAAAPDIEQALQERLGYAEQVAGVEQGTLWIMKLAAPDLAAARQIAQEITVTRARDEGLLSNPHFQAWQIL